DDDAQVQLAARALDVFLAHPLRRHAAEEAAVAHLAAVRGAVAAEVTEVEAGVEADLERHGCSYSVNVSTGGCCASAHSYATEARLAVRAANVHSSGAGLRPELLRREGGALGQYLQLRPRQLGVHAAAHAAVCTRDH